MRTFRAQRIAAADELTDSFVGPSDFNLEAYWNESNRSIEREATVATYDVIVRVSAHTVVKLAPYWTTVTRYGDRSTLSADLFSRDH